MYGALRAVHLLPKHGGTETLASAGRTSVYGNLDFVISEHGKNLSAGEKQLICLARAILKRHRIVVLDEATSSVDYKTDKLITETIEEEFKDTTLLVIAHRLRTVISYDKVLVMSAGRVAEFGRPVDLLQNQDSAFHALYRAAGSREFKILERLASNR